MNTPTGRQVSVNLRFTCAKGNQEIPSSWKSWFQTWGIIGAMNGALGHFKKWRNITPHYLTSINNNISYPQKKFDGARGREELPPFHNSLFVCQSFSEGGIIPTAPITIGGTVPTKGIKKSFNLLIMVQTIYFSKLLTFHRLHSSTNE